MNKIIEIKEEELIYSHDCEYFNKVIILNNNDTRITLEQGCKNLTAFPITIDTFFKFCNSKHIYVVYRFICDEEPNQPFVQGLKEFIRMFHFLTDK